MSSAGPMIVAYDGSPGADAALRTALNLGGRSGSRVVALYVYEPLAHLEDAPPPVDFAERREAVSADLQARIHEMATGDEATLEVVDGIAGDALLDAADSHDASMIVTGTRRRRALAELVLGSVARHLVAHSNRPVLVVPPPSEDAEVS